MRFSRGRAKASQSARFVQPLPPDGRGDGGPLHAAVTDPGVQREHVAADPAQLPAEFHILHVKEIALVKSARGAKEIGGHEKTGAQGPVPAPVVMRGVAAEPARQAGMAAVVFHEVGQQFSPRIAGLAAGQYGAVLFEVRHGAGAGTVRQGGAGLRQGIRGQPAVGI